MKIILAENSFFTEDGLGMWKSRCMVQDLTPMQCNVLQTRHDFFFCALILAGSVPKHTSIGNAINKDDAQT